MKIAFELPYYAPGARGPSQYGEYLVRALGAAAPQDRFYAFAYFHGDFNRHRARIEPLASSNVELAVRRWPQRLVDLAERRLGYPFVDRHFLAPEGVDVFHDSAGHPVDTRRTAVVSYLHGAPLVLVGIDPFFEEVLLPRLLRATRLIALSNCIRDFMLKYYPVDPERICVIPYGLDHSVFRPIDDPARLGTVRRKYALPERFLLCVGPFQFRDNVEHLLRVLSDAREDAGLRDLHVVLAGGLEEHGEALVRIVQALGLADRVHFPGYVPHPDLAAVYTLALVFVHSSYYEEFGAQTLEAAACGAPIVASDTGGIREAAGDAPLYFNPHRLRELRETLGRVIGSPGLREEMRGRGVAWSRQFSWDDAARKTLEVYRAAAAAR